MAHFDPNNKQHLITAGGRKFITFVGLQARLADLGIAWIGTQTEMLQNGDDHESGRWIMRSTCTFLHKESGTRVTHQGIGDAQVANEEKGIKANMGSMVEPHAPRMAETRAEVRALRKATRSEYTAAEEIGDN